MEHVKEELNPRVATLLQICTKVVSEHMHVLEKQVWDLPVSLLEELLPHLNIFYLERIEDSAVRKGLSTDSAWFGLWMEVVKNRPPGRKPIKDWRQKFLERLFHMTMFGNYRKAGHPRLQDSRFSVLTLTAKYVKVLILSRSLIETTKMTSAAFRPVMRILEGTVTHMKVYDISLPFLDHSLRSVLLIFHRLLHHGSVRTLIMSKCGESSPILWTWMLQMSAGYECSLSSPRIQRPSDQTLEKKRISTLATGNPPPSTSNVRTSQVSDVEGCSLKDKRTVSNGKRTLQDEPSAQCFKLPRLERAESEDGAQVQECILCFENPSSVQMHVSKGPFEGAQSAPSFLCAGADGEDTPMGKISALVLEASNYVLAHNLAPLLPSWICLHSLQVSSEWIIEEPCLLKVVEALSLLSQNPDCSLSELSISSLSCRMPIAALLARLLSACPRLEELTLGFIQVNQPKSNPSHLPAPIESSLKTLRVEFPAESVCLQSLVTVLRGTQSLTSLYLKGIRCKTGHLGPLLFSLPECSLNLQHLSLDDINLSGCHREVLHLLKSCLTLKGLCLTDCRLFEKNKQEFLAQLISSVKCHPSLTSLTLSRNRLGNDGLIVLADLFSGESPSRIRHLNVSANYILPNGLLEFGALLESHRPPRELKLDVRENPLDRDPQTTARAMKQLGSLCHLIKDCWNSRTTFADHISVM
ncbi:leucine-rich repeat-containing protein 41 [Amia ocellicauda]|uniref:leucine-rich repeat-containing protein 41 n=1 Tax=Amia ocellicauda TaxID=2972642 RepID=UPI00346417A3